MSDLELVPSLYFIGSFRSERHWMEREHQYQHLNYWGQVLANLTATCGVIYSAREQKEPRNPHFHGVVCVPSVHAEKFLAKLDEHKLKRAWFKKTGASIIKMEPYKLGFGTVDYCWPKHEFSKEPFCQHHRACVRKGCRVLHHDWLGVQQFLT